MEQEDLLDSLLAATAEELEKQQETSINNTIENVPKSATIVKEIDIFENSKITSIESTSRQISVVHDGNSDSSDDEDRRYFEEQKYNQYGREIKTLIKSTTETRPVKKEQLNHTTTSYKFNYNNNKSVDVYIDPIFRMRIIKPQISTSLLTEKMEGREAVNFSNLSLLIATDRLKNKDWVICGVVVSKSPPRTSQKGHQFSIWTLSDLKDDIKTVSLFMFSDAHKNLWKTVVGTVVAVLNPNIMEKRDGFKDVASLSIDTAQKVMIFGHSKDYGVCKSIKKNGDKCTAIVNLNRCEFCTYHIKQEYQAFSKRSELQANFTGHGLTNLRNKVLGKNEVFYAGKSYMAIPTKKSNKLDKTQSNQSRKLNGNHKKGVARQLDIDPVQQAKDLKLLRKLVGINNVENKTPLASDVVTLENSKTTAISVINRLKSQKVVSTNLEQPKLSGFNKANGLIDLNTPINASHINRAKMNAIKYIQSNGPIKKSDPNSTRSPSTSSSSSSQKKRKIDVLLDGTADSNSEEGSTTKKPKVQDNRIISDRIKRIMAATSRHTELIEQHDNEQKEKYFKMLETKEKMEEKMANTYQVKCKAVKCLLCKYTSFSALASCKNEKHPLKVFDAEKRFFKCLHCQNRIVSLDKFPIKPCKNCGDIKWQKTGMMKEKLVKVSQQLSIRGGEQTFLNSNCPDANLDLLVPDDN